MSFQSINIPQPILLSPPLHPPLVMRTTQTSLFGGRHRNEAEWAPCDPCRRYEPAISPGKDYIEWTIHEAIDLEGSPGDCVFAAYAGTVVEVNILAGGTKGNITIDHHEEGQGLVTRYLHLDGKNICVKEGLSVTKGQRIASLSAEPLQAHLHFEIRSVINPGVNTYWGDKHSIALDPTRIMYPWEAQVLPVLSSGPFTVSHLGTEWVENLPFFRAYLEVSHIYSIPLYEPMTEHEKYLIQTFERAFDAGRRVEVDYRDSVYFGAHRIPVSVRIV